MRFLTAKFAFPFMLLMLLTTSCTEGQFADYRQFSSQKLELLAQSTALLKNDSLPVGAVSRMFTFEKFFVLPDNSHKSIQIFDKKSNVISVVNASNVTNDVLPKSMPCSACMNGDTLMLLYSREKAVYFFTSSGRFLKKIHLQMPDLETSIEAFAPMFSFDPHSKVFFISINDNLADILEKYKSAALIGKFDEKGKFVAKFGKYPEYYSKGYFFPVLTYSAFLQNDRIYTLFAFDNKISEYDTQGNLKREYFLSEKDWSDRIEMKKNPVLKLSEGKISLLGRSGFMKIADKNVFCTAENTRKEGEILISVFDFEQMTSGSTVVKGFTADFGKTAEPQIYVYDRQDEEISVSAYLIQR